MKIYAGIVKRIFIESNNFEEAAANPDTTNSVTSTIDDILEQNPDQIVLHGDSGKHFRELHERLLVLSSNNSYFLVTNSNLYEKAMNRFDGNIEIRSGYGYKVRP